MNYWFSLSLSLSLSFFLSFFLLLLLAEKKYMGPALLTYVSEPYQYAQIGGEARFFCEGFIGKCFLL
jgi:hypothetical protein